LAERLTATFQTTVLREGDIRHKIWKWCKKPLFSYGVFLAEFWSVTVDLASKRKCNGYISISFSLDQIWMNLLILSPLLVELQPAPARGRPVGIWNKVQFSETRIIELILEGKEFW